MSNDLELYVYDENIIPETGVGGYAYSTTILSLAIDTDFADKEQQRRALVGTIFHESYHLVQGHTGNDSHARYSSALDSAIYEGCATVFEREYTDASPLWGEHVEQVDGELQAWAGDLAQISPEEWMRDDGALWQRWSFYDENDGQRWKSYKVGVWLVERCLRQTGKDIRDLRMMSAQEVRARAVS